MAKVASRRHHVETNSRPESDRPRSLNVGQRLLPKKQFSNLLRCHKGGINHVWSDDQARGSGLPVGIREQTPESSGLSHVAAL